MESNDPPDYITIVDEKTSKRSFICPICQVSFLRSSHARRHILSIHFPEKQHVCNICNRKFARADNLRQHSKIHEENFVPKKVKRNVECTLCGKHFPTPSHVIRHMRIHTGEKPFECGICKKRFTRKDNLNQHEKIHFRDNPRSHFSKELEIALSATHSDPLPLSSHQSDMHPEHLKTAMWSQQVLSSDKESTVYNIFDV
ncbi:hypothetical protein ROZALSC1DRAFT_11394 [Rozella allomycis CSF55]|uniref:C2H2-type domain-containing protein n=1 Tax=Rozella allomycis (strain CSF55) TaxID=988480 RepID=A0A4P9YQA2_ROZAC|nr:hypothetical protein ROZALSC1DRAFT_11394 [Rozella allomycis CSF55]